MMVIGSAKDQRRIRVSGWQQPHLYQNLILRQSLHWRVLGELPWSIWEDGDRNIVQLVGLSSCILLPRHLVELDALTKIELARW